MDIETRDLIEPFEHSGEGRALRDLDGERVQVDLVPADDQHDDVWITIGDGEESLAIARLAGPQAIRLGRWLVAAGDAAVND
ncbi:MAG: hypothetical protein AUH85_17760 [Chloroflexi bacterium 13_1_40CM_4_68_4]|nr:MAG: hypothetical protein AUH85_17760 [Chloroflexi bacterium 13_1_40CM_4_68_4]